MGFHHHREDDAVEHNVVLTDEVNQTSVLVLPPLLPGTPLLRLALTQLNGVAHIAYRSIEPHIEHLTVGSLHRNRNAPVQVARHGTWLQVHVKP